jgi:hypothetical protein
MAESVSPADELRLLEEKRLTVGLSPDEEARLAELSAAPGAAPWGGFDVTAAAAEVRAAIDPAAPAYDPSAWAATDPGAQAWDASADAGSGAAAEAWGEAAPAAVDPAAYGLDPNDPNAVAWAAWYAEQGWTLADVEAYWAQQAQAEGQGEGAALADVAAPCEDPGTAVEPEAQPYGAELEAQPDTVEAAPWSQDPASAFDPGADAVAPDAQPEVEGAPLDASPDAGWDAPEAPLAATWDAPVEAPSYAPDGEVAEAPAPVEGATSMWDLGTRAAASAPPPAPGATEFQHDVPAGWPGDSAPSLLDDLELASGGSFSAGLASPPQPAAPTPELPPFDLGAEPQRAELPEVPPDIPIDLALEEEGGALPPVEPEPGTTEATPPVSVPPLDLGLELTATGEEVAAPPGVPGWAEHAIPPGDHAVDFAAFDAEPHDRAAPEAPGDPTAMWGLAGAPPEAPALDIWQDEPEAAPVGESPPEPWTEASLAAPSEFLAFAAAAAGADTPAPAEVVDVPPAEVEEILDEDILEVGEDVIEVTPPVEPQAVAEPEPPPDSYAPEAYVPELPAPEAPVPEAMAAPEAALPPLPDEPVDVGPLPDLFDGALDGARDAFAALPELAAEAPEPPLAPEPLAEAAPAYEPPYEPPPPAEPPPPHEAPPPYEPEPTAYVTGTHRVVIHTSDGQVKRGTVSDLTLDAPEVLLAPQAGGTPEPLAADRIKAIFFMLPTGAQPPSPEGKKVRVTFRDGRQVAGFSPDYDPQRVGFFMIPVDTRTHTARIWVYRASVRQVSVS